MTNRFDQEVSRTGTASFKYDGRQALFGRDDVIPLWIADMDFAVPEAVQHALSERAMHPIYGYTAFPESLYESLMSWTAKRYSWTVAREAISMCPGVVPSLHACIMALTKTDEAVIVQPPVYAPFIAAPEITGRKILLNPLKQIDSRYEFDLDHLAQCGAQGGRLLLLCSPHNPVGRVWEQKELQQLLAVCRQWNITVVSDEIHADLIYAEYKHTPLAKLDHDGVNIITAVAPSKTFNIPGMGLSALIVPQQIDRAAINKAFDTLHVSATNPFSIAAFEAAYWNGAAWLDELMDYLAGTRDFVRDFTRQHLPNIKMIEPEGTYLVWLDCREMKMSDKQLKQFFVNEACVGLSPGMVFGKQGSGFMRMNIAAPRSTIATALENIANAVHARI